MTEKACRPMKKSIATEIDVSHLYIKPGHFTTVISGPYSIEIICKDDGTFQVYVDDETLRSGIHRYEEIYESDLFKEEADD